jgi:hypothetical protein
VPVLASGKFLFYIIVLVSLHKVGRGVLRIAALHKRYSAALYSTDACFMGVSLAVKLINLQIASISQKIFYDLINIKPTRRVVQRNAMRNAPQRRTAALYRSSKVACKHRMPIM